MERDLEQVRNITGRDAQGDVGPIRAFIEAINSEDFSISVNRMANVPYVAMKRPAVAYQGQAPREMRDGLNGRSRICV